MKLLGVVTLLINLHSLHGGKLVHDFIGAQELANLILARNKELVPLIDRAIANLPTCDTPVTFKIRQRQKTCSLLTLAALMQDVRTVNILLQQPLERLNPGRTFGKNKWTTLHFLVYHGEEFTSEGSPFHTLVNLENNDVNTPDKLERTPLMLAAQAKKQNFFLHLYFAGGNLQAQDHEGKSVEEYARERGVLCSPFMEALFTNTEEGTREETEPLLGISRDSRREFDQ